MRLWRFWFAAVATLASGANAPDSALSRTGRKRLPEEFSQVALQTLKAQLQQYGQTYAEAVARESYVINRVQSGEWPLEALDEYQAVAAGAGQVDSGRLLFEYAVSPTAARLVASREGDSLHAAAAKGSVSRLRKLLASYAADPDQRLSDGTTPLHAASLAPPEKAAAVIKVLAAAGATLDAVADHGATPLMSAAMANNAPAVQALLTAGADPDAKHSFAGGTALSFAAELGCVEAVTLLCAGGADVEIKSSSTGGTALHTAADVGQAGAVAALLRKPCSANAESLLGGDTSPLYLAAQNGHLAAVAALLEGGADPRRRMPMAAATQSRELASSGGSSGAFTLNAEPSNGATALHAAAEAGHADVCRLLVRGGANLNDDGMGASPLMLAAQYGRTDALNALLELGADLSLRSASDGATALHFAVSRGHAAAVKHLLRGGAHVDDKRRRDGATALSMAVAMGFKALVPLLLQAGASLAPDEQGATPLHVTAAAGDAEVLSLLTERSSDFPAAILARMEGGRTAVHLAAAAATPRALDVLLCVDGAQAALEMRDAAGALPLHIAVAADSASNVRALAAAGADLSAKADRGDTPLLLAVRRGSSDVAKALLDSGASPDERGGANSEGLLPLVLAVWKGDAAMATLLLEAGGVCAGIMVATDAAAAARTLVDFARDSRFFDVLQVLVQHENCGESDRRGD